MTHFVILASTVAIKFPLPFSNDVFGLQGRHTKTGQLAAIKVMDVTEVSFLC